MTNPPERAPATVLRFDRVERMVHWANAALFGSLMLTGARCTPVRSRRSWATERSCAPSTCGAASRFPLPLLFAVVGTMGLGVRADLGRLNRWTHGEGRWFRKRTRSCVRLGKFNPGQKLNVAFISGAGVVMLGTGSIMHWFGHFPIDWRTGATFMHDWFTLGIWLAVLGHIAFALRIPMRSAA